MKRHTKEAFLWIVGLLKKHKIPFRLSGGFAARIYGSRRPLADIDVEIQDKRFKDIVPELKPYLVWGPKRYRDSQFQTYGMSMEYEGQVIDISGTDSEILYDKRTRIWVKSRIDIEDVTTRTVYGIRVPLIPKDQLIAYKSIIRRPVDLTDIRALTKRGRRT